MRLDHLLSKEITVENTVLPRSVTSRSMLFNFQSPLKRKAKPKYGGVAQLGEHLPCKQGVRGSNPLISTKVTDLVGHRPANGLIAQLVRAHA